VISYEEDIFQIPARRCKRCGGLLTSEQSIRDGYGHHCRRVAQMEAAEREEAKNQFSLFSEPERRDRDVQV
jgi:hypothetical protein